MAQLFGVGVPAISKHLKNIFEKGELSKDTTVSKMEIVVNKGFRREVPEEVDFYSLDASLPWVIVYHRHELRSSVYGQQRY
jgi:hypothetical protein